MTDRVRSVVVAFEQEVRVDDLQEYIKVFRSIRGVADVTPGPVHDIQAYEGQAKLQAQFGKVMWALWSCFTSNGTADQLEVLEEAVRDLRKKAERGY